MLGARIVAVIGAQTVGVLIEVAIVAVADAGADAAVGAVAAVAAAQAMARATLLRKTPDQAAIFPLRNTLRRKANRRANHAATNREISNPKVATINRAAINPVAAVSAVARAGSNHAVVANRVAKARASARLRRPTIQPKSLSCSPANLWPSIAANQPLRPHPSSASRMTSNPKSPTSKICCPIAR
jgi:hypothetical protein